MARELIEPASLTFRLAVERDAPALAALHAAAADRLTGTFGEGRWSSRPTEGNVLRDIRTSRVLVACDAAGLAGTLRLATKKPWAIDPKYFTPVARPLYLLSMAVAPSRQRSGIGRSLIGEAMGMARAWPAEALRLDAYDAPAGAGEFYRRCGFTEVGRVEYRACPLIYFEKLVAASRTG